VVRRGEKSGGKNSRGGKKYLDETGGWVFIFRSKGMCIVRVLEGRRRKVLGKNLSGVGENEERHAICNGRNFAGGGGGSGEEKKGMGGGGGGCLEYHRYFLGGPCLAM